MDDITKKALRERTELFIKSINLAVVCDLASSYNGNRPCSIFSDPLTDSYNICYPVVFGSTAGGTANEKWIVRIPLEPCVELVDEKLENEVAVMRFVMIGR
jgi:hypothetical protein